MNWLTSFVRPKIQTLLRKREVPENLWHKCPACEQMIFHRDLEKNLCVCPHCGHHLRIAAARRLDMLFDDGAYQKIELPKTAPDPLRFRDLKRYSERLKEAQARTGLQDAAIVAHGRMGGRQVVVAAFEFEFLGGSMGLAVGEALVAAGRLAVLQGAPLVVIPSSGGARMQEGILSLVQMPRTTIAVNQVKEAGLPYVVVLTDPTTGGVSASFAMLGDIALAEPGAVIGFAGQRVIQETIREKLPEGFQRAEYLYEHGMVDMVVPRGKLRETLIRIFSLLCDRGPAGEVVALPRHDLDIPAREAVPGAEAAAGPASPTPPLP
ncbi:MAG: acetyl-CoA carboxylase carboxyltransferase subunit beta [Proteobacteria bacterium]|nr:acetyl-CoA carboxylase carboxyltransferase subunit beta [Pseudomonadota bacterium]